MVEKDDTHRKLETGHLQRQGHTIDCYLPKELSGRTPLPEFENATGLLAVLAQGNYDAAILDEYSFLGYSDTFRNDFLPVLQREYQRRIVVTTTDVDQPANLSPQVIYLEKPFDFKELELALDPRK